MDDDDDWRARAAAEYAERRDRLMADRNDAAQQMANLQARVRSFDEELGELDTAARVFGLMLPDNAVQKPTHFVGASDREAPIQFKDLALELLKQAHPNSLKAKEIQTEVERRNGKTYHWKTAGMTLFRLAQDGIVRRDGHKWFYVPLEDRPI